MEKKTDLKDGIKVHYYGLWDSMKGVIFTSLVLSFIIGMSTGNFGVAIVFWVPLLIPVWIVKVMLQAFGIISVKEKGVSIKYDCPYCSQKSWSFLPSLRIKCPSCKKEIGFNDGKVYKITKDNEDYFKLDEEKTNENINKLVDKDSSKPRSNLSEIKELKELLDMGAITQEEYDTKKKEILNKD